MRVITYNIRGGLGLDGRRDTRRIAQIVAAAHPDVACFQEVHQRLPWSGWQDQPGLLRRELEMPFTFQKCFGYAWGGYGLGIATRLPIRRVLRHRLPGRGEPRGALEVQIEDKGQPIAVFCTHWGLSEEERAAQAQQMSQWVQTAPRPVLVCGDLNDVPSVGSVQDMMRAGSLQDAGAADNALTYPADAPRERIDVILYSGELRVTQVCVLPATASDHRPLVVDFTWNI